MQPGLEDTLMPEDIIHSKTLSIQGNPNAVVIFRGTGDITTCQTMQQRLLKKTATCERQPCSMNGVYQPMLNFDQTKFYAMSEYWYTAAHMMDKVDVYGSNEFHRFAEVSLVANRLNHFGI